MSCQLIDFFTNFSKFFDSTSDPKSDQISTETFDPNPATTYIPFFLSIIPILPHFLMFFHPTFLFFDQNKVNFYIIHNCLFYLKPFSPSLSFSQPLFLLLATLGDRKPLIYCRNFLITSEHFKSYHKPQRNLDLAFYIIRD